MNNWQRLRRLDRECHKAKKAAFTWSFFHDCADKRKAEEKFRKLDQKRKELRAKMKAYRFE